MPRALFEKTGRAVWMSHLDLMRLFQRAFKRAGLPLTHTHGFNPRPSVSIALPLSVGVSSNCELLDFDLEGEGIPCDEICRRLNDALVEGVCVREVYENGRKIRDLALLDCNLTLEYDAGIEESGLQKLKELFGRPQLFVEKRSKNGITEQDIIPMIHAIELTRTDEHSVIVRARICCQNPTLNPMQLPAAINRYLPELTADHVVCSRVEIYDTNEIIFR